MTNRSVLVKDYMARTLVTFKADTDVLDANLVRAFVGMLGPYPPGTPVLLDIHDTMVEIYQDRFGVGAGQDPAV